MKAPVHVIGGGLAGCEAAWQLARRGVPTVLHEMRPKKMTPAHKTGDLAELVCSNSLRSDVLTNAAGLLKEEMRRFGSLILQAADDARVPAGSALAVDREAFSAGVLGGLQSRPEVEIRHDEVTHLPDPETPAIIASGPLTSDPLAAAIAAFTGQDALYFYDAIAPVVDADTVDTGIAFRGSRYGRGDEEGGDYLNCPFNEEEYTLFYDALCACDLA
jgi:methylenetetrahydrofolate--tRNA-(uracil-5-)-methyltransferase